METYTLCYNTLQVFDSKAVALAFYKECYYCSEGSEHERYANIIIDLFHKNIGRDYVGEMVFDIRYNKNGKIETKKLNKPLPLGKAIEYYKENIKEKRN